MSDIQRWDYITNGEGGGPWVTYADHVAAVTAAEERMHEAGYQSGKAYGLTVNGFTRGVKAARDAVNGIEHWASYSPDGDVWTCFASDPVHVIDALRDSA